MLKIIFKHRSTICSLVSQFNNQFRCSSSKPLLLDRYALVSLYVKQHVHSMRARSILGPIRAASAGRGALRAADYIYIYIYMYI